MEPITLGAIAFLALVGEKTLEKTVEISLGKAFEYAFKLLKRKSPGTVAEIEATLENRALPPGEREDIGEAVLVEKLEAAAEADTEIKTAFEELNAKAETAQKTNPDLEKAIQDLIEVVKTQRQTTVVENWQGINTKGGTVTINSPQFNFGQK
jgi:predicted  nucleic acid-binding Zn-ribbon protein